MPHTISSFMTKSPITVERDATMAFALRVMEEHGIRHLPVVHEGHLLGLVSERELRVVENMRTVDSAMCIVGDFLLAAPYSVAPETSLREVVRLMAQKKYGSAVVVDGDVVIGVFTTTDALHALAKVLDAEEAPAT